MEKKEPCLLCVRQISLHNRTTSVFFILLIQTYILRIYKCRLQPYIVIETHCMELSTLATKDTSIVHVYILNHRATCRRKYEATSLYLCLKYEGSFASKLAIDYAIVNTLCGFVHTL